MPVSDFAECLAYEQMEPFGEKGDYLRAGIVASVIANVHRDPKRKSTPYEADDFIPDVERPKKIAQKIHDAFLAAMTAAGGVFRVKPKKK